MPDPIKSPCILVCQLDYESGYCLGCGRTSGEIAGWLRFTPGEREAIMSGLSARLESIGMPPAGDAPTAEARAADQRRRGRVRLR